jgi:hypothetical protein
MIPIYCKAKKNIKRKLKKDYQICEFLSDGEHVFPVIRFVSDVPLLSIQVTKFDFERTYINQLLILNNVPPLFASTSDFIGAKEMTKEEELIFLEKELQRAEANTDYELAARLRDEIKRLKNEG